MKHTKKKLLGLVGLIAVGIMTAIAYCIPLPGASAVNGDVINEQATEIKVIVTNDTTDAHFLTPTDRSVTTKEVVPVSISYSYIQKLEVFLDHNDSAKTRGSTLIDSFTPEGSAPVGTHDFDLDLAAYSYGPFTLRAVLTDYDGTTRDADTVSFQYDAVAVGNKNGATDTAENGDPIINLTVGDKTDRVVVDLYNKDGSPVLDKDGKPVRIELNRSDIDPATGQIKIVLPFEKLGIKPGDYVAVITAYDKNGNILSTITYDFKYSPDTPNIPNTGFLTSRLNLSRMDYIVSGLIAFAIACGFAISLIYRRTHS